MPPKPRKWPSFEEIGDLLTEWDRTQGDRLSFSVEGYSPQQRPVYMVTLTDPSAAAEEKEHTVLSAVHTGGERSAAGVLFGVMHWLLSDDPKAREVLRRQVVVCLPVVQPDGYVQGRLGAQLPRHDLVYSGWDMSGVTDPDNAPEASALQAVIDRYQPDVYADVHGISLDFDGQLMLESSACSPSMVTSRPYHQQIARMMDQAALKEGFPSDFQEDDRELLYWGPAVDSLGAKLWPGRGKWSPGLYAYANYHTLQVLMEITWQRSGVLRFQRLLRIGNERWEGEHYPGYPNRVVGGARTYEVIAAYGQTARQRRASRVELWGKHGQLGTAPIDPQMAGKTVAVFTTAPEACRQWLEGMEAADAFAAHLEAHSEIDAAFVQNFLRGWPGGQNRPEPYFSLRHAPQGDSSEPIENGIAFRLRIPFPKARIRDLRLNGRPLPQSAEDGYITWKARGFTFIQVNVPPPKANAQTLFVVTCEYDPGEYRPQWEKWTGRGSGETTYPAE